MCSEDKNLCVKKDSVNLFCSHMKHNIEESRFKHITIGVFNHAFVSVNMPYKLGSDYKCWQHILQVSCNETNFSLFRELNSWPVSKQQLSNLLSVMFGDNGWPFTISYYDTGKWFNSNRYTLKRDSPYPYPQVYDTTSPFGFYKK